MEVTRPEESLELRDARLSQTRTVLLAAQTLVRATVARHRPHATGPAAAVELDLLADRLSRLGPGASGAEDHCALLRRAAVLCAGEHWDQLTATLPTLRSRITVVTGAIGETAAQACRESLRADTGRPDDPAPDGQDALVDELVLRRAKAGADSAYAAADRAFLPSLADFLH